ncbi:hypothetical protein V8C37DRAFT_388262 [Trichoderma ceciliae]
MFSRHRTSTVRGPRATISSPPWLFALFFLEARRQDGQTVNRRPLRRKDDASGAIQDGKSERGVELARDSSSSETLLLGHLPSSTG